MFTDSQRDLIRTCLLTAPLSGNAVELSKLLSEIQSILDALSQPTVPTEEINEGNNPE
jgi:hypothetical protein